MPRPVGASYPLCPVTDTPSGEAAHTQAHPLERSHTHTGTHAGEAAHTGTPSGEAAHTGTHAGEATHTASGPLLIFLVLFKFTVFLGYFF